jgi:methylglutamate dehydrogenase subunit B
MRLQCPFCGERSCDEFVYHGDAQVSRPDGLAAGALEAFVAYVYERTNPPGLQRELWYHAAGCHAWLVVTRNITTHAISSVETAREVAQMRAPSQGRA